jgi:ABC-type lipoprotein export system ATPase subunit
MPESAAPILTAENVRKSYDGREVLCGVSLTLRPGERLALMGPSGSGKTTLLNCLGGIDKPDTGRLALRGQPMDTLTPDGLAALRRREIGSIFQFFHLLPTLTAAENIALPLQLNKAPIAEAAVRVSQLMERVGISHRTDALPAKLSGGEMQRVAIARALVHRPALLLADEPTGNLDSANGANVLRLLEELSNETGTALVLVTHSTEATRICHRTIHLRDGLITAEESVA